MGFHLDLKRGMEYGGGLRNLNKAFGDKAAGIKGRHDEWNAANLEVLMSYDMGEDFVKRGWVGWWIALSKGHDIPSMLTSSYFGRRLTMATVKVLEWLHIAEPGTYRTALMLEHCGFSASVAGQMNIFTPAWVTIGIKPLKGQALKQGTIATSPDEYYKILASHPYYKGN